MIKIKGIELNEIEDLDFNLQKVRAELEEKLSFWSLYKSAIEAYEKNHNGSKAGALFKVTLLISLLPKLVSMLLSPNKRHNLIIEAEKELINYYQQPISKVKRFRLKCQFEKQIYENEIKAIQVDLDEHYRNLELSSLGDQMKAEIQSLIQAFESKKKKKLSKYNFYAECEKKLINIEEQIKVQKSIEKSRLKLEEMEEVKAENSRQQEIEEEFELYQYYGNLLDSISMNMRRLEEDKSEKLEEVELKEMINQIELRN